MNCSGSDRNTWLTYAASIIMVLSRIIFLIASLLSAKDSEPHIAFSSGAGGAGVGGGVGGGV